MADLIIGGLLTAGTGAIGAITTHDIQNYMQARRYLEDRGIDPDSVKQVSARMVPNRAINAIQGFQGVGVNAQRRSDWGGISSPTHQGLFYRIFNNPFSHYLNSIITEPDPKSTIDPRTKALSYGYLGGVLGGLLGGRWRGLSGAAIGALAGSTSFGLLGIYSSHSSNTMRNAEAVGNLAILSGLPLLAAGGIYGLTRIPKIGGKLAGAISKTNLGLHRAGVALEKGLNNIQPNKTLSKLPNKLANPLINMADYTLALTQDTAVPFLKNSGPGTNSMWEQSVGLGQVLTFVPTHVLAASFATNIYKQQRDGRRQNSRTKRKTSTLATNRRAVS